MKSGPAYSLQRQRCMAEKRAKPHIMHMFIRIDSIAASSFSTVLIEFILCGISVVYQGGFVKQFLRRIYKTCIGQLLGGFFGLFRRRFRYQRHDLGLRLDHSLVRCHSLDRYPSRSPDRRPVRCLGPYRCLGLHRFRCLRHSHVRRAQTANRRPVQRCGRGSHAWSVPARLPGVTLGSSACKARNASYLPKDSPASCACSISSVLAARQ